MAHHGAGVVTQSVPHHRHHHHHHDAAQIARIWMSGPARSDQQERHAAAVVVDTKKRPAEEQDEPVKGPTCAGNRRPAAGDQTCQPPCAAQPTANNNQEQESSAAVDPNQPASYRCYDQPQSPLFGKLPAELRLMVWEHALTPASAAIDRPAVAVGLLETCWRAYDETKLLVYERNQVRAHLLQSPLPGDAKVHWTRLLSAEQQARTHLNLYVQPGASSAWGWNLLRWTKKAGFQPATLQLTVWFTSGGNWWRHYVDDMFKSVRAMRGVRRYVFELRTERDRFAEFDKRVRELRARRIALADGSVLVGDGRPTEYFEGSRVMMDNVFGRPTRLSEEQQPRWIPCQDPEKDAEREMLATVLRWEVESDGSSSLSSA